MPNWCDTTYAFIGSEADLDDFEARINEYTARDFRENGYGTSWLGNVIHGFGHNETEIGCRGWIEDIQRESSTHLQICTQTAWTELVAMWDIICHHNYDDRISYVYRAEEPSNGHFINTDSSGEYFPEKYLIDAYLEDYEDLDIVEWYDYYETTDGVLNDASRFLKRKVNSIKELKNISRYISKNSDHSFFSINEFRTLW